MTTQLKLPWYEIIAIQKDWSNLDNKPSILTIPFVGDSICSTYDTIQERDVWYSEMCEEYFQERLIESGIEKDLCKH